MPTTLTLKSSSPHDFYLTLDIGSYFEAEYEPETIVERGYVRPLTLAERPVLSVVRWNEDIEEPVFEVRFPQHTLTDAETTQAEQQLRRILGTELDLRPLMDQAGDDEVLGPLLEEHYGFKRLARANLWAEMVDDFIRSRIRHRPTGKRMSQDVRRTWGTTFEYEGTNYFSYPQPATLAALEPEVFRDFGISRRKGEYMIGLGESIESGTLDLEALDTIEPETFYEQVQEIRGIGPSTAQDLMFTRPLSRCVFPSNKDREGHEKGLRRWLIRAYDADPDAIGEDEFLELTANWRGYEALAVNFMYLHWVLSD